MSLQRIRTDIEKIRESVKPKIEHRVFVINKGRVSLSTPEFNGMNEADLDNWLFLHPNVQALKLQVKCFRVDSQ